ncbi:hypothetical protein RB195_024947 [Necator americanus]|uniref:EGF-like domain-containing protein n=1 Tax=Necator americanus TaxID=51031 RepID=A0ABR1EQA5_NECAM
MQTLLPLRSRSRKKAHLDDVEPNSSTRSQTTSHVNLLTVVDSSSGITLGKCSDITNVSDRGHPLSNGTWTQFQWVLKSDSLLCTISSKNSQILFPSTSPRTFSVRLQSEHGPSCLRNIRVQNEVPVGCPPHFSENSFSSSNLGCGCALEVENWEHIQDVSTDPHFPLLELDSTDSSHLLETRLWTVSPCADFICQNNGTCVVTHEESAACLCRDGFSGVNCEVEECGSVPCQNGGSCRSQDGEAHCDCAPPFTGILCESVVAICEPACANGECVIQDDRITCECMQGFVGSVCNVVDVCLGDTACSIFGQQAKCIIDKSSYMLISSTLYNASYECKCPHPIDGEYVDCLALHLSTSVFESFPASVSPVALFLTTKTEKTSFPTEGFATEDGKQGVESGHPKLSSRRPTTDAPVNSTPPKFSAPEFVSEAFTNLYLHQVDTDTGREVGTQTKVVNLLPLLRSLRCPTPLPPILSTVLLLDFQILNTLTLADPIVTFEPFALAIDQSAVHARRLRSKEISTEAESIAAPTIDGNIYEFTSPYSSVIPTNTSVVFNEVKEIIAKTVSYPWVPTTQTTIPLWATSMQSLPIESIEISTMRSRPYEASMSTTSKEDEEYDVFKANVTRTSVWNIDVQKSSAASWIVAIVAVIIIGLLLLATTLLVLRYVRQSRKLHGKYNPAREEHALSTSFSVPMSHMSRDERLI